MVTRRSARAGSSQPAAPAAAPALTAAGRSESSTTSSSDRRLSAEYLAYSSDDEFEEFMYAAETTDCQGRLCRNVPTYRLPAVLLWEWKDKT